jgi:hypothetical protein
MGCTTAVLCRLWVTLICQTESSGTCSSILLGLSNQSIATQIFPLAEDVLQSTGPGTAGGGSAGVIQTSVASLSGKAIRIAGYIEVTWTSGTGWATTPSKIQVSGPGVHKPGDVLQTAFLSAGSVVTCANGTYTNANISQAITPASTINGILINAQISQFQGSSGSSGNAILSRGTGPTTIGQTDVVGSTGSTTVTNGVAPFQVLDFPATTSAQTYAIFCKGNGSSAGAVGGTMTLQEIMGALEPANDGGAQAPNHKLAAREWVGGRHERAA